MSRPLVTTLILLIVTAAVYWQVHDNDFINYDDDVYVTENANVQGGLTWEGIKWAFTTGHAWNYHPLTWISHMLDYQVYGLKPGGHHISNLLFHLINTLLLFSILRKATNLSAEGTHGVTQADAIWQSVFVAGLFALHPLHVESVAWVAERKDVLSTMFWLLTMLVYVRYVEKPTKLNYLLVALSFALGLLSKPMLVTLPFVLLLLDYWPLGRIRFGRPSEDSGKLGAKGTRGRPPTSMVLRLVYEKLPLFFLAIAASVVTYSIQASGGGMMSLERTPFLLRMENAIVSYASYLVKMVWPVDLAVLYPFSPTIPAWQVVCSALFLLIVTIVTLKEVRRSPFLAVGWFWYLGTLVPVIGLVQVGVQALADRYTYIPLIGIFVMVAWGLPNLLERWRLRKVVLSVAGAVSLLVLSILTHAQVGRWKDSITLFEHTLNVTSNNFIAHYDLGLALYRQGRSEEALEHYLETTRIRSDHVKAHISAGALLARQGKADEAIGHFQSALRYRPSNEMARENLANVLAQQGRNEEAVEQYSEVLRINPNNAKAHYSIGLLLAQKGRVDEAISHYSAAIKINPDFSEAHQHLGYVFASQGELEKAITHFETLVRLRPEDADAHYNLATLLARQGKLPDAEVHFRKALELKPDDSETLTALESVMQMQARKTSKAGSSQR
jgi:tetratricopeptide (TPR) repeat protein